MSRRQSSHAEDLLSIVAALPWWLSVLLAGASFVLLRPLAGTEPATPANMDLGPIAVDEALVLAATVGQFALPIVFMLGAAVSIGRRLKRASLFDTFAGEPERDQAVPHAASAQAPSDPAPLPWRAFETLVSEVYTRQGYRVEETAEGQDGGVDLVLRRDGQRYFVRCKRWQSRPVEKKGSEPFFGDARSAGSDAVEKGL